MHEAEADFPEYEFLASLTPSEQKCAFRVTDKKTGEELCLKLISPDYSLDRLQREIQALQGISHSNVVRFVEYTYSSTPNSLRHYMIEEYIEGCDLTAQLTGIKWEAGRASSFFAQIADALEALGGANLVHRDLKPQNIRVRPDGSPVIIDFGLARHLSRPDLTHTAAGAQIGTPLYFAPEQFQGTKRDIDHRTDLFALGVILHEALVGFHPFYSARSTRAELEAAVCGGFIPGPEFISLPANWRLVISRLLAVDRSQRMTNAVQLKTLLSKVET